MRTQNFLCPIKKGPHWDSEFFLCPTLALRRKKTSFSKENMIKKSRLPEAREIQLMDLLTAPQFHLISFLIGLGGSTFFFFTPITKLCLIKTYIYRLLSTLN